DRALLDGVLVAVGADGRPDRARLLEALAAGGDGAVFYAFDLLHWEDYDLRPLPLLDRKAALRATLPQGPNVLFVDHVAGSGPALARVAAPAGFRALIAKRAASAYASGPSPDWQRVPVGADAEPAADGDPAGGDAAAAPARSSRVRATNLDK